MEKTTEQLINDFNSIIKKMGRIYLSKKKDAFDEEKVYRTNKRVHFIISTYPDFFINIIGPFYLKYRDYVSERDWDSLLEMDFTEEKQAYKNTDDGSVKSEEEMDAHIACVKDLWVGSSAAEQGHIGDIAEDMLSIYCQYVLVMKKKEE